MMLATSRIERRSHAGEHATEKRSLASILRDHGPIPVTDAVDIALDVCDELASAHANGIVHGDLGMHRVRTHWPRIRGQRVDIFSLGENDSAAFSFRASASAVAPAPAPASTARRETWLARACLINSRIIGSCGICLLIDCSFAVTAGLSSVTAEPCNCSA